MNRRTRSIVLSALAGAALGGIALAARYAPAPAGWLPWARPSRTASPLAPPAPLAPSASVSTAAASPRSASPPSAPPGPPPAAVAASVARAGPPIPRPRAERFATDPVVRAACPADMTLVDGEFCPKLPYRCIRRTEEDGYRCAEYQRGVRCMEPTERRRFCVDRYEWPNRVGENPLVYVDWHEAKALCASVGKRLCRRSEWMLACEGPKRLPYPWGFVRQPSPCNIDRAPIDFDVPAMLAEATREEELARLWQADRIGSHPDCVSAFGAYDMAGNVDEWTDDQADNPSSRHPSTLNGGYWGPVRDTCRLTTTSHGPNFKFYQVGFRCCADTRDGVHVPPPSPWIEADPRSPRDPYEE